MNTFMRDSGPEYPCDMEPEEHHCGCSVYLCEHCNPRRELITAMLQQSMLATERRLRPDNVVRLDDHRPQKLLIRGSSSL